MTWELCPSYKEVEESDEAPCPRAGHCAAVVGTRMYVWSGRDAYKRVWNTQVWGVCVCVCVREREREESKYECICVFVRERD